MGGTRAEETLLRKDEQGPLHIMLQKVGFILGTTWSQQTGGSKEVIWIDLIEVSHENFSVVDKAYVFILHDFMNDKLIQRSKQTKKSRQSNLNSNYSVLLR